MLKLLAFYNNYLMFKILITSFFIFFCIGAQAQSLNCYYGNIHAHSSYSDGNKDSATSLMTTPIQDFLYAKQSLHTDFYGLSEHNHESAGMKSPVYFNKGLADADAATIDGQFVALYGMEWGVISSGGHVILYGFDSLCGWDFSGEIAVPEANYNRLWQTVNRKGRNFAYLAHPQSSDYENIFNLPVNAVADSAIVGMAMRSGPAFSTNNTYSNPSTSNFLSRYNDALKRGYHLGVGLDHDTHNSVFDRQSEGRLVAMAPILNRAEIIEAMRRMRFYSSDDWNIAVSFVVNNMPMGSIVNNAGNPTINVAINDADGETTSSIALYYGVPGSGVNPTLLTSNTSSNTLTYSHSIANNTSYYYYLYITQADGDKIWSSPIWYNRNDNVQIQTPVANFSNTTAACANYTYQLHDSSSNNPTGWWWEIPGANPPLSSLQNPLVTFPSAGSYTITLTVNNQAGTSSSISQAITVLPPPQVTVSGNFSICNGLQTSLTAQGATSYLWSNGSNDTMITVQPNISTDYMVTGYDAHCFDTAKVNVTVYQALVTPIITTDGISLFSNYTTGNQWYLGNTAIMGATLPSYTPTTQTGVYRLGVSDSTGCMSNLCAPFYFQLSAITETNTASFPYVIYPNPNNGKYFLTTKGAINNLSMKVINVLGERIYQHDFENLNELETNEIQLPTISAGIYFVQVIINGKNYSSKMSIE